MVPAQINYLAVLATAIIGLVIGAIWYSPKAFGPMWQRLLSISGPTKMRPITVLKTFAALLVMSYILAHFIDYVAATTLVEGGVTGIWVWLGFIATTLFINIWNEDRPLRLWLINAGYYLVVLAVTGGILAIWA